MWIEIVKHRGARTFVREGTIVAIIWDRVHRVFTISTDGGNYHQYDPDYDTIHRHEDFDLTTLNLYAPDDEGCSER